MSGIVERTERPCPLVPLGAMLLKRSGSLLKALEASYHRHRNDLTKGHGNRVRSGVFKRALVAAVAGRV